MAPAQSDIIGTTGRFSTETGSRGAVANRQVADQLYRQAIEDEKTAWKTFPPNVSLLAKALTESKEAKQADDQAKEFARASLHGMNSGSRQGDFSGSQYGKVDEKEMRSLASGSSPWAPAAQGRLGAYGLKLDADRMSLQTPMGKFPVGMPMEKYEQLLRSVATSMGYRASDVTRGIQDAIRARESIARAVQSGFESGNAVGNLAGAAAREGGGLPGGMVGGPPATVHQGGSRATAALSSGARGGHGEDQNPSDRYLTADLARNRRQFLQQMGARVVDDQTARANMMDDIFQVVHLRYQSIRAEGSFIEF